MKDEDWYEKNVEVLQSRFNILPSHDVRGHRNTTFRELNKPIVFITMSRDCDVRDRVLFHGFDNIEDAMNVLMQDLMDTCYNETSPKRYRILQQNHVILGTLLQGKVVRLFPVTTGFAVLTQSLSEESNKEFDVWSGLIPFNSIEVVEDESSQSQEASQDDSVDDTGLEGQDQQVSVEEQPIPHNDS